MTIKEIQDKARKVMAPNCRVCRVCNGKACRGEVPGAGGIGSGNAFIRSFDYLENIEIYGDYLHGEYPVDTTLSLFDHVFSAPVFAAPVAGVTGNYNGYYSEAEYAECVLLGCKKAGTAAFTGDGSPVDYFEGPLLSLEAVDGWGIPTVKPWGGREAFRKMDMVKPLHPIAIAMDIDGAGYARAAAAQNTLLTAKSPEELKEIIEYAEGIPFIIKGILTPESAVKAVECGASAIVVSSHGGRVNENTPAPMAVLPAIKKAVGDSVTIFVDGAIRNGSDIFKALAFGADAVLIGRPYVVAAHGEGIEGVAYYTKRIIRELEDVMRFTGCRNLKEITVDHVRDHNDRRGF